MKRNFSLRGHARTQMENYVIHFLTFNQGDTRPVKIQAIIEELPKRSQGRIAEQSKAEWHLAAHGTVKQQWRRDKPHSKTQINKQRAGGAGGWKAGAAAHEVQGSKPHIYEHVSKWFSELWVITHISGGGNTLLEAFVHGDGKSGEVHEQLAISADSHLPVGEQQF